MEDLRFKQKDLLANVQSTVEKVRERRETDKRKSNLMVYGRPICINRIQKMLKMIMKNIDSFFSYQLG